MKKILTTGLATLLLTGTLLSASEAMMDPFNADFAKMNKYFNSLVESHLNTAALSNINYPRTDIEDKADAIIIKFDLAGVKKEDIKLTIDDNKMLTIAGKKEEKREEKSANLIKQEIFYGSFKKMIQLPKNSEVDRLKTEYKNGILTLTIPKKVTKKPAAKIIPIP